MHELSIAQSILELALERTPAGTALRSVLVRAGPMRGIDPEAMELAWRSVTEGTPHAGVRLELDLPPWALRCPACGVEFEAAELHVPCRSCGGFGTPLGGDELTLMSLTVEEASEAA